MRSGFWRHPLGGWIKRLYFGAVCAQNISLTFWGHSTTGAVFLLRQNSGGGFVFVLAGVELVIVATLPEKLGMGALLHDFAAPHHQDHIAVAYGGKPVSDH